MEGPYLVIFLGGSSSDSSTKNGRLGFTGGSFFAVGLRLGFLFLSGAGDSPSELDINLRNEWVHALLALTFWLSFHLPRWLAYIVNTHKQVQVPLSLHSMTFCTPRRKIML